MTATGQPNGVKVSDLLGDIEDAAPVVRAATARATEPFVPDAALVERITASFGRTGAFASKRAYAVVTAPDGKVSGDPDAKRHGTIFKRHAEFVADSLGKSVRDMSGPSADDPKVWHIAFMLTHKRYQPTEAERVALNKAVAAKDADAIKAAKAVIAASSAAFKAAADAADAAKAK